MTGEARAEQSLQRRPGAAWLEIDRYDRSGRCRVTPAAALQLTGGGRDAPIGESLRIGAAADNDFRVEVTGISRHHARIVRDGADFWLEDSGSTNGTFVNGLRVARERLRHLDVRLRR